MSIISAIKEKLANRKNYGPARSTKDIKYLVIHYTGNDGDTDENNGKYFANNVVGTSAHYFVDDDSITRSVPENYVAWHCGTKGTYRHKYCRNTNSIGIEICDDVKNGTIYPSAKTIENVLELVEYLMEKYSIPKENVIRHYDVTGKKCPSYWCGTAAKNAKWKTEFWDKIGEEKFKPYLVKVTADSLNLRAGIGTSHKIIDVLHKGDVFTVSEVKNGWGRPKWYYDNNKQGWVNLAYVKRI